MDLRELQNLSDDTQNKMSHVFDWFNSNVSRLEHAYKDIGLKFDKVSQELEEKNSQLIQSFVDNEAIKTQLKSVLESMSSGVIMIDGQENILIINIGRNKIDNSIIDLNLSSEEDAKTNALKILDLLKFKKIMFGL